MATGSANDPRAFNRAEVAASVILVMLVGRLSHMSRAAIGPDAAAGAASDYQVLDYDDEIEVDLQDKQIKGRERIQLRSLRDNLEQVGFPRNGIDVVALRSEAVFIGPRWATDHSGRRWRPIHVRMPGDW